MDRRAFTVHLTVLLLLAATCLALLHGVDVSLQDRAGVRLTMPANIGAWRGHQLLHCHAPDCRWQGLASDAPESECPRCGEALFSMAWVEKDQLPPDTAFSKYVYERPGHPRLWVSIVVTGSDRGGIHRPQRCLVAQGHDITRTQTISLPLPERDPLRMTRLTTLAHRGGRQAMAMPYVYWFVGQNRETPSHLARMFWLAWDRIFHGTAHRWAYLTVNADPGVDLDFFMSSLRDFLPLWYPRVLANQDRPARAESPRKH